MNTRLILAMLLFLSLLAETSYFAFPFVFIVGLTSYIFYPDLKTLALAAFTALTLDALKASPLGLTSISIFISIFIFEVSKSAFEIKDYKIIMLFLFVATFTYANIFSYSNSLLLYILVFLMSGIVLSLIYRRKLLW